MIRNLKNGFLAVILAFAIMYCYELCNGFRELQARYSEGVDLVFLISSCPFFTLPFAANKLLCSAKFAGLVFAVGTACVPLIEALRQKYAFLKSTWIDVVFRSLCASLLLGVLLTFFVWHGLNLSILNNYFGNGTYGLCWWSYDILADLTGGKMLQLYLATQVGTLILVVSSMFIFRSQTVVRGRAL